MSHTEKLDDKPIMAVAKILVPLLRLIEPGFMKFLLVLAVLLIFYSLSSCRGAILHDVLVFLAVIVFAVLGCGLQFLQYRIKLEERTVEAFKTELREVVRQHRGKS